MALGAQPDQIIKTVMGQAILLTISGIAIGGLAAWALTRLLASLLYHVDPGDPSVYLAAAVLLALAGLSAGYLPARRAASIDPVDALRMG
ncbi:MAG: hypothetical protein NVS9B15_10160 [Acidobacteriaceae bacterium]